MSTEKQPQQKADGIWEIPLVGIRLPRESVPWFAAALVAVLLLGWSFLRRLPDFWFDEEGYYSHGLLIPFMTLAAIYMRRDKLRSANIGQSTGGFVVMCLGLACMIAGRLINNLSLQAFGFIIAIAGGIYFAFGKKVGFICLGPILFLTFMVPALGWIIDTTTNPLQLMSAKVAVKMLSLAGYQTLTPPGNPTAVEMDLYSFQVGGPCSGFKLILALAAFTTFFVMISNLRWVRNLVLFAITLPLALVMNGLRIMFIGIVGEASIISPDAWWVNQLRSLKPEEHDVGMIFHDYSGYIMLFLCFIALHYIVKALEWRKQSDAKES